MRRFAMRHLTALALGLSVGAWASAQTPGTTPPGTTPPGTTPPGRTPPTTTPPGTTPPGTTPPGTTPPATTPPSTTRPNPTPPTTAPGQVPKNNNPLPVGQSPGSGQNPTGQNPGVGGAGQNPGVTGQVPNRQSPTGSFYPHGLPHSEPLFQYQNVRKDLNINDQQLNQLNETFNSLNTQFNTEFGKLTDKDREKAAGARNRYWGQWKSGINRVLTPEQLKRYRQLDVQYRGWGALMDPQLQTQLNLSAEQKQRLDQLHNESLQTYSTIHRMGQTNPKAAMERYRLWREQTQRGITEFLTDEQRRNWAEMTGEAYSFTPNFGPTNNRPPTNATVPREPAPNR
jgi:hypothetical protein